MALLARLILVGLCVLMFVVNRRYKFAILILATICLKFVSLPMILGSASTSVLSNCFILSELPLIFRHITNLRKSIIWTVLVVALIAVIIQLFNSPYYNDSIANILRLFYFTYVVKYLALAYAFVCIAKERDLQPTMKVSFYGLLVLTMFGVVNYITGHADFINELGRGVETYGESGLLGDKFTYKDRFRVQAMFFNPFDYGYICIVMAILHYWGYLKGMLSKSNFYISMACCLFGIFTCGCRTVIVCAFLAFASYLLFGTDMKKRFQYALLMCIIGAISYSTIPYVRDKVDSTMTAFDADSDYGGSSIEMRTTQYATVLLYIDGHEWLGRGYGFFNIDMGWSEGMSGLRDHDFWGLEGVFMGLLLESGVIGVIIYIIIYGTLFYYSFKYRKVDKQLASLAIAALVAYFSFANMTGELSSVFPTLLVAGSFLSILYNKDRSRQIAELQDEMATNSRV